MANKYGNKSKSAKIIGLIMLLIIIVLIGYAYLAPEFEKEAPVIKINQNVSWNRTVPLVIEVTDNVGLKHASMQLADGVNSVTLGKGKFKEVGTQQTLLVKYPPKSTLNPKAKKLQLKITVHDSSMWNFLRGNVSEKIINIDMDYKKPIIKIIRHSYSITKGGSGLVIFQVNDENLESLYIEAAGKKFEAQPYKKEGYFVALIAWPFNMNTFKANIVAMDKAKNKRIAHIPFYTKNFKYKVSWIKAKDKFIDGKITDLATNDSDYAHIDDRLEKLRAVNEDMRLKNEKLIHALGSNVSNKILDNWKIKKFYPLRGAAKVASYGDERHYYYEHKENEISKSFHVGYDLASTKMATIKTSNPGKIVYAKENGIYGLMPMIDHGLGLYSLYGHCSQLLIKEGDYVKAGQDIAKTGSSGLALGDHLHFGLLVQGIEVRPIEWFDSKWINTNITRIFEDADTIILN